MQFFFDVHLPFASRRTLNFELSLTDQSDLKKDSVYFTHWKASCLDSTATDPQTPSKIRGVNYSVNQIVDTVFWLKIGLSDILLASRPKSSNCL